MFVDEYDKLTEYQLGNAGYFDNAIKVTNHFGDEVLKVFRA